MGIPRGVKHLVGWNTGIKLYLLGLPCSVEFQFFNMLIQHLLSEGRGEQGCINAWELSVCVCGGGNNVVIECVFSIHKVLGSSPSITKPKLKT